MRYAYLALILSAGLLIPAAAEAQVTTTGLSSKGTLTVGQIITSGTTATLLYSQQVGTTGAVRGIITTTLFDAAGWGPLDTGVLTGLSLTGGLVSTTAQISGLLTNTGGIVGTTAAFTGTGTFGQLFTTGVSANRVVHGGTGGRLIDNSSFTYDGTNLSVTGGLISTSATITNLVGTTLTIGGNMTLTGQVQIQGYHENFGRVDMRNTQSTKLSIGTVGQAFVTFADTTPSSYVSIFGGYGIGFSKDTGGVLVGIASTTDGLLKITNGTTTSGLGALQTGNISMTGALTIQPGTYPSINLAFGATPYCYMGQSVLPQYITMFNNAGISFAPGGSPQVGLVSNTNGILRCNNSSTGVGTFQTGGFLPNLRNVTDDTSNITLTDYTVTFTNAGAVTLTLPSAISRTGQVFYMVNKSAVTGTAATTSSQTINGITTKAILGNSSLSVQSDGANFIQLSP